MNLFSINIAAVMAFVSACLIMLIFMQKRSVHDGRKLLYCLVGAVVSSIGLQLLVSIADKADKIPSQLWLMLLPLTASLAAAAYILLKTPLKTVRKKIYIPIVSVAFISSLLLGLVALNDYYHYYPTISSVFGVADRKQSLLNQDSTTLQFANQTGSVRQQTIEGSLYNATDATTSGTITPVSIPGALSHFSSRSGFVYTPAIALAPAKINLPVIVLTEGVPGSSTDWIYGGDLKNTMDSYAAHHKGIVPYVFVIDELGSGYNDTECVDSSRGNVETYLTKDVPNYIKANYEVTSAATGWGIGGLSLGGLCGIMLTLRHPDIYTTFMDLGGEIAPEVGSPQQTAKLLFKGSLEELQNHEPLTLLAKRNYPSIGGYFAIGKKDKKNLVDDMRLLFEASQKAKIESVYEAIGGEHSFNVWAQGFKDALPWMSNRLGATQCVTKCN